MKPPTKDWSSEHQSPSCKSSLFQTSGVLIQTPPGGELLVRNQYSSWGVLWPTLYKDPWKSEKYALVKGLKSLSRASSADQLGGPLMQLSKVHNGFMVPKLNSRTLQRVHFKKINQRPESSSETFHSFEKSGQWKYDKQLHKQRVPFTQNTTGPSAPPPALSLWRVFWFKFHCGIRLCCGLGFTSHFLFLALTCFLPWIRINSFHTELWYQTVFLLLSAVFGN